MGTFFSKLFSKLFHRGNTRILILGLENAGKTTLLYQLQFKKVIETIPTIGFNVEFVQYRNVRLQMWDLGGQKSFREHWKCYYPNTQGIVYVIDSSDWARFELAKEELCELLKEEELKSAPVLVLANKQDLPGAMSEQEMTSRLWIHDRHREIKIVGVSVKNNSKLESAFDWLVENMNT